MINQLMTQLSSMMKSEIRGDDYTTGCSLDSAYFQKNYKLIAVIYVNKKL